MSSESPTGVDRDRLVVMLGREGEAFAACRQAVLYGARFRVPVGTQSASIFAKVLARRERFTREKAVPTLGFADAVAALRDLGEQPLRLGAVETDDPPYHYQLFVNGDGTAVIACLGVDQSWKTRQRVG